MNNKILVDLYVPMIDEIYNIYLPVNIKFGDAIKMINKTINELTLGLYSEENNYLYSIDGRIYAFDMLIKSSELKNGSRVVLL